MLMEILDNTDKIIGFTFVDDDYIWIPYIKNDGGRYVFKYNGGSILFLEGYITGVGDDICFHIS